MYGRVRAHHKDYISGLFVRFCISVRTSESLYLPKVQNYGILHKIVVFYFTLRNNAIVNLHNHC